MYPWRETLTNWADHTKLHVDALGLVTILGSDEVDSSVGRLVPSAYLDFLPLLGAFVIAGDRFVKKKPSFTLYNVSSGVQTTEISGWFSRWLKEQDFSTTSDIVHCRVPPKERETQWRLRVIGILVFGIPLNGMLIALTILSGDWWGFANAVAMVFSVIVRQVLVCELRAGIDRGIDKSRDGAKKDYNKKKRMHTVMSQRYEEEKEAYATRFYTGDGPQPEKPKPPPPPPNGPEKQDKIIVVLDDAKAVTIKAPQDIVVRALVQNPEIPHPLLYTTFRWIGWIAFAAHILTLGMASLHTQIYSVLMLIIATVLTVSKVGCEDWRMMDRVKNNDGVAANQGPLSDPCWISSKLQVCCSKYPENWAKWDLSELEKTGTKDKKEHPSVSLECDLATDAKRSSKRHELLDDQSLELGTPNSDPAPRRIFAWFTRKSKDKKSSPPGRRQDLYVWLEPSDVEEDTMKAWDLLPRNNEYWMEEYKVKKKEHRARKKPVEQASVYA